MPIDLGGKSTGSGGGSEFRPLPESQDVRLSLSVCVRSVLPSQEDMAQRFPRPPRLQQYLRNRPIPATVSSGPAGLALPLGVAPSLLNPSLSPGFALALLWGRPSRDGGTDEPCGARAWASRPPGRQRTDPGPAQRPAGRATSPAAPSAVGGRAQPAGKQPGSPGQPRGWAVATCFRSDLNSQRGRGGVGRGGGEGLSLGDSGADRAWPPLPPLISLRERAPGEGSLLA